MELFPDGGFVRLQNRANQKYVHADGDWVGVSLRSLGTVPSLEAVWRVEHWVSPDQGNTFVLLQNAAYGRYLSFSNHPARPGHLGRRVIQCDFDDPNPVDAFLWRWRVQRVDPDQDYVRLRYADSNFHLRANGKYLTWNTGVTGDLVRTRQLTTMMQWTVHAVATTPISLPLPVTPPEPQIQGGRRRRGLSFWALRRCTGYDPWVYPQVTRMIRHVRANDEGEFDQNHHNWPNFVSNEESVFNLSILLGQLQDDWNEDMLDFTLCIRPGSHGRLMPLITHLPRSVDPLSIVVFRTGSPADAALVYPLMNEPAP